MITACPAQKEDNLYNALTLTLTLTGQIELLARGAHLLQPACSTGLQEEGDTGKMGFPLVFFFKQYRSTT